GKTFAERVVNPILEGVLRASRIFEKIVQTIVDVVFIEDADAVLERVFNEAVLEPNGVAAEELVGLSLKQLQFEIENLRIFRENDVSTEVEGESIFLIAAAQPTALGFFFQDLTVLADEIAQAQPGYATA